MTVIKQLKLHGFKSFAKSTEVPFSNGFSIIVGSNGSGKSNIADSMMFVLGSLSTKTMRAEKAPSLIYNGGKLKNPAKQAQVDVVFDNSSKEFPIDGKEVKISRVVRQTGSSIYKINDEVRTRQQVIEVLNSARIDPDGHNIVLQGDIVKFTEMKPEERRGIIEEAAGISIYEDKKKKSMNELNKVDEKLKEAGIILTERRTHLHELKEDRDQAIKYKELETKIKQNKATYIHIQIREKEKNKEGIERRVKEQEENKNKIQGNIDSLKNDVTELQEKIKEINQEVEEKGEKDQLNLQNKIEELKTSVIKKTARIEVLNSEISKTKERIIQLNKNNAELEVKINSLNKEVQVLEKRKQEHNSKKEKLELEINKLKEKYNIKDDGSIDSSIDEIQEKITSLQGEISSVVRESDRNKFSLEEIDKKLDSSNGGENNNIKELRQEFKKVTLELNKSLSEDSVFAGKISKLRDALNELNEKQARLNAKAIVSRENPSALLVKRIINSGVKGIYNTVGNLGNVDKKYSTALEVAAGPRINAIVTENDQVASKCIQYLKDNRLGVATFLPINKIRPFSSFKGYGKENGIHGLALDLVQYNPKFKNIFSYVFGSTLVVENVDVARKVGIGSSRMVTIQGDLIEQSGAMIGGFRRPIRGAGFKEEDVESEVQRLEVEIGNLKNNLESSEDNRRELEEKISKFRNEKLNLEAEILKIEKVSGSIDFTEVKENKKELIAKEKEASSKVKNLEKELQNNENLLNKAKEQREKSRTSNVGGLNELEEQKKEILNSILNNEAQIKSLRTQVNDILEQEKERSLNIVKSHDKEVLDFSNELKELIEEIKNEKLVLRENEKKEKSFYSQFKNLINKRNKYNEIIQKRENSLIRSEEQIRTVEERINNIALDKAKILGEVEGLKEEFKDFENEKIRKNLNLDEIKYDLQRCEKSLENLGNVNLRALEIYEQLEEDYSKLVEKSDKLKLEKDDVLEMMQEIEDQKKDKFLETFKVIDRHFKENFMTISDKGQSFLELENPENPLEEGSGVDIKVKLIANKYLDIRSLSGGEKTLTALAFIFAIQEFNPASFYLFDEVDAALDKANSEKLSKLIAKYASKAQYIVISHNDSVVSEADQIYGVSMQQGVSKVISMKM